MPNKESQHSVSFDELYRELILDHYRNPRNRGGLEDATVVAEGLNPSCGDEIQVSLGLLNGSVGAVRFSGQGCSISQSSASMLTEEVSKRTLAEARALSETVQRMFTSDEFDIDSVDIGDLEALQGVRRFPVRIKCALLAWKVLDQAIAELSGESLEADTDIQTRIASASGSGSPVEGQERTALTGDN